ncbi:MAG: AAA family ATPase [Desulfovibrio sp.]|nr:AAA family ATPase [Desulfovibrio sp.]
MKELPTGVQGFAMLRREDMLYVDKTARLLEMIRMGRRIFLSRPRRFGKSLTVSTLEAMFGGRAELFHGLVAEDWVHRQSEHPCPVIRLDMSMLHPYTSAEELDDSLARFFKKIAKKHNIQINYSDTSVAVLSDLVENMYDKFGDIVFLVDEYDKPILDNITDVEKSNSMRIVLRNIFTLIKGYDEYFRYIFITGISKFTKAGIFSAMNNLNDISMQEGFGDIVGYTQDELNKNFKIWVKKTSDVINQNEEDILKDLKEYYNGFCFDGKIKVYNPYSILMYFTKNRIGNYWYYSGNPAFIIDWMQKHQIQSPEQYRHIEVDENFADNHEIERAQPESFLFQSGYLTIEKRIGKKIILDYPNKEVLNSISSLYLENAFCIKLYMTLGSDIWKALQKADIAELGVQFNKALADIAYDDFPKRDEFWYRSLFRMLLRGADIVTHAEVHASRGRSDVVVQFDKLIVVLEFKFAPTSDAVEACKAEGIGQMQERRYARGYEARNRRVVEAVVVADDEARKAMFYQLT